MGPAIVIATLAAAAGCLGYLLAGWPGGLVAYCVTGIGLLYVLSMAVEEERRD